MAKLCLPSRTILSIVSQEHMPRDRDASNPVAFNPVPPTGSVSVPGYISAYTYYIWVSKGNPAELGRQVQIIKPTVVMFLIQLVKHSKNA